MFDFFNKLLGNVNNKALEEAIKEDAFLVDVRSVGEFSGGSVRGAVNIPLGEISKNLNMFKNKNNIVVFCRSGNRSQQAKHILDQNGFKNVVNGGTWTNVNKVVNDF